MSKTPFYFGFLCLAAPFAAWAQVTPAESNANQRFTEVTQAPPQQAESSLDVRFIGDKNIPEAELRTAGADIFTGIQSRGLTPPRADDAAFYLEVYYRRHGFTYSEVDWQILNNGRTLQLTIDEGPLTNITSIVFEGNDHYEDSLLRDFLIGATRERFSRLTKTLPYVEQDVQTGWGRLESFYRSEGFLDAKVLQWPVEYSADLSEAKLGTTIIEGLQYQFGKVQIKGATPEQEVELRKQLEETLLLPYTEVRSKSLSSELQYHLKSQGYFNAQATVTSVNFDTAKGLVDIIIDVMPDGKFRFDGYTTEGSGVGQLRPQFLAQRLGYLSGKTYDPVLLEEVYREIVGTGLFSEFRIKETPIEGQQIRLDVLAKENPPKEFGFYGGFGTYEGGFVGTSYQDRNLWGYGRPLTASIEASQRGLSGAIEYVDPWFRTRGNELRLKLFSTTLTNEGYSSLDIGFRADLNRKFTKEYKAGVFVLAKSTSTTAEEIDPLLLGPSTYQTLSAGVSQSLDYRNNPLAPGRGWVLDSSLAYTQFSSGASGLQTAVRLSYYLPLGKWLLALGARSSSFLTSADLTEVPIDDRYFNGGGTTVRSFAERELGPLFEQTYPLGGLSRTVLNAELVVPLAGDLKGAVFLDAGNLLAESEFFSTADFRYGIGVGIRYNLPVGPLRLDYGYNPSPQEGNAAGAFHFSFGFAF